MGHNEKKTVSPPQIYCHCEGTDNCENSPDKKAKEVLICDNRPFGNQFIPKVLLGYSIQYWKPSALTEILTISIFFDQNIDIAWKRNNLRDKPNET